MLADFEALSDDDQMWADEMIREWMEQTDPYAKQDAEALVAAFYPDKPMAELSGTGYAFRNRQAARAMLSSQYTDPSEANIDEQVEEVMANDGISVLSIQD